MFNTSGYNKDFREWSESIMTGTQERIKKLKEAQRDLQWQYDMELYRLESEIKKKEEAIDDLNASLFEMAQMNTDKDKLIKGLQIENNILREILKDKEYEIHKLKLENQHQQRLDILEKHVADLEQGKKLFLLDDNSTPIKSFTMTGKLTIMNETTEEKLEVDKWYDTRTFDVEELERLLPMGTNVIVTKKPDSVTNDNPSVDETIEVIKTQVTGVYKTLIKNRVVISVGEDIFNRQWFKIVKEN